MIVDYNTLTEAIIFYLFLLFSCVFLGMLVVHHLGKVLFPLEKETKNEFPFLKFTMKEC